MYLFIFGCAASWRRKWQPTPVFLPGESRGSRSLAGYSPWDRRESDATELTLQRWVFTAVQACVCFGEQWLISVVVHGLPTAAASLVAEHRL